MPGGGGARRRLAWWPILGLLPSSAWAEVAAAGDVTNRLSMLYGVVMTVAVIVVTLSLRGRLRELRQELQQQEAALARSAAEWSQAMDFLDDPMYLVDLDDRLVRANKAFYRQIGKTPEEALGLDVRSLIHLKPEKIPCPACAARLEKRDAFFTKEANDPTNPTGRPIEVTVRVVRDEHGQPVGMLQGLRDLSHLRATEEALFREKERAQVTLNSIGDAVVTTDGKGMLDYLNPVAEKLLGQKTAEVRGRYYDEILNLVDEKRREPLPDPILKALGRKAVVQLTQQTLLIDKQGNEYAVDVTAAPILDREGQRVGAVLVMHDVTAVRGMTRQLNYQATHDALTGLINRREFEVRLRQVMESAQVDNTRHAMIFLDLDRFKAVNDTCGHVAGDELLKQVSERLLKQLRNVDTLARLGGDEFAVLLECCPLETAERIGNQLLECIKEYRLVWGDKTFEIGASLGLVEISADSPALTELIHAADSACYAAKRAGRNRLYRYRADDEELLQQQGETQWVHRINQALADDRFELYSQAIKQLDSAGHGYRHFEILLRMLDETGKIVPPGDFIPAAERLQLMQAIDRWVIGRTLAILGRKGQDVQRDMQWSINLSGQSLGDKAFLGFVEAELARSGVDPRCLCFEITETAAVASLSQAREFIDALRVKGIHFSLDDFGSGLSSFAYLKNLQVDYLKIDGGFVKDMVGDNVNYTMVRFIHEIGRTMGIRTVAEFVENEAILGKLHELQVDFGQGYGIERPRPLLELLAERAHRRAS
jgi:diguanylate cyclase (GGDEF)-like protein/PAS domain S-box-containing protein